MQHRCTMRGLQNALLVLTALASLSVCEGQTFKFAHLRWTACSKGFYDPYFPSVCKDATSNPRAIGFTLSASWGVTGNDPNRMLQQAFTDVSNFVNSNNTVRNLRLYRNKIEGQKAIKIGWREGKGMDTVLPPSGGIVDCPVPTCIGENTDYMFQIDRVSTDRTKVYARYSFEIIFPEDGVHSVYFEGCCRQTGTVNNELLTFHVRTEVLVSAINAVGPKASLRFEMPDTVVLRQVTSQVDAEKCAEQEMQTMAQCSAVDGCYHNFQVQALHPVAAFRSQISYRMADANEMGRYKCLERSDLADPTSPFQAMSTHCEPRVITANFASPASIELSSEGVVSFRIDKVGAWQATVVAVCEGCAGGGEDLISVLDFGIEVIEAWRFNNWQPPYSYFGETAALNNRDPPPSALVGITPLATFNDMMRYPMLQIQCGRSNFRAQRSSGLQMWDQSYLRIAYTDDFSAAKATCGQGVAQSIDSIVQMTDLPKGIAISPMTKIENEQDAASAYIDLAWRPQCEDYSQVGSFLMCFRATDHLRRVPFESFAMLPSYPGIGTSRSCLAVESLPVADNPAPAFQAPTKLMECSEDCCDCCGRPGCGCANQGNCCAAIYATAGDILELAVRAVDVDPFERSLVYMTGLQPDQSLVLLPAGVNFPKAMALKYGCGDTHYTKCDEAAERAKRLAAGHATPVTNDVQALLRWDLGAMGLFTCVPVESSAPVKCNGLADTSTCLGGSACKVSDIKKTIASFKVCYQTGEGPRPGVDLPLWLRTFGRSPEERSCKVCFMLSVADKPFFIDYDPDFEYNGRQGIGTPFSGIEYHVAVGDEVKIELLAAANNVGQIVQISLLAEPGAPLGSRLTEQVEIDYEKVTYDKAFLRHFIFVARKGQEGLRYDVCFQGVDGNDMKSRKKCFSITVFAATISWEQTTPCLNTVVADTGLVVCPPDGHFKNVTVGCQYSFSLSAISPLYSLQLRQQKLASCMNCLFDSNFSVVACSSPGLEKGMACCGNGLCDGVETGASCPTDCRQDDEMLTQTAVSAAENGWMSVASYTFTPTRGVEGRRLLRCFEGVTNAGAASADHFSNDVVDMRRTLTTAPSFCLVFEVQRCSYCVPQYATMKSLAQHYLLNMDWLRIYNSNPALLNPDALIQNIDVVAVGPLYKVQKGDTLLSVAAMAKTTLKSILQVNSDVAVASSEELEAGQEICLLLCSSMPVLA